MTPRTYAPPRLGARIDLDLSKNEGPRSDRISLNVIDRIDDLVRRYPDTSDLRSRLAGMHGLSPDQILLTAGGDDALFRCFLSRPGPDTIAVATRPTFEMIPIYADQVGVRLVEVEWPGGPFPIRAFVDAARGADVAFVVSPNNPTGSVITESDLRSIAEAVPLVVLDAAYAEFADVDPTPVALSLGNVVVVRTLSKAYGLAGLRVGYLLGPDDLIDEIGSHGGPYPVSALSAAIALQRLDDREGVRSTIMEIRSERAAFAETLSGLGVRSRPSQGNFVLVEHADADQIAETCAELGIGVRRFPGRPGLEQAIRITMPGNAADFARLERAITTALSRIPHPPTRPADPEEVPR